MKLVFFTLFLFSTTLFAATDQEIFNTYWQGINSSSNKVLSGNADLNNYANEELFRAFLKNHGVEGESSFLACRIFTLGLKHLFELSKNNQNRLGADSRDSLLDFTARMADYFPRSYQGDFPARSNQREYAAQRQLEFIRDDINRLTSDIMSIVYGDEQLLKDNGKY
ncbi:MAG: hypothetical protein WCG27_12505, partial [Pseudomonadota bacterium]